MKPSVIITAVCNEFCIKRSDMLALTRKSEVVTARQVAYWLMRDMLALSHRVIGEQFMRDHTTVGDGIQKINHRMNRETVLNGQIYRLKCALLAGSKS